MGLIVSALTAVGGFLLFFHGLQWLGQNSCVRAAEPLRLISGPMDALLIGLCFAAAWVLAYFRPDAFSFYSFGTKFYGREPVEGAHIATIWLTAFLPVLPVRSFLILHESERTGLPMVEVESASHILAPLDANFHWPQVLRTALISYGTTTWCAMCMWVILLSMCF
jgi:hypothetical protein